MLNGEIRSINLMRIDVCDVLMAITGIRVGMMNEIRDENITETRREILQYSLKKWDQLHDKIQNQLDEQDEQSECF